MRYAPFRLTRHHHVGHRNATSNEMVGAPRFVHTEYLTVLRACLKVVCRQGTP